MEYVNGIRISPFPNGHWTDGLSQHEIVRVLFENGAGFKYVEMLSKELVHENYFGAVNRSLFWNEHERLDDYLVYDSGTTLVLWIHLMNHPDLITFKADEVGSLIRFDHYDKNDEGVIPVNVLWDETRNMELNPAQLHELEKLLNKAGRSLGIELLPVPEATEQEKFDLVSRYGLDYIKKKPRRSYVEFLNDMLIAGTPVSIEYKEFHKYAEKVLNP